MRWRLLCMLTATTAFGWGTSVVVTRRTFFAAIEWRKASSLGDGFAYVLIRTERCLRRRSAFFVGFARRLTCALYTCIGLALCAGFARAAIGLFGGGGFSLARACFAFLLVSAWGLFDPSKASICLLAANGGCVALAGCFVGLGAGVGAVFATSTVLAYVRGAASGLGAPFEASR